MHTGTEQIRLQNRCFRSAVIKDVYNQKMDKPLILCTTDSEKEVYANPTTPPVYGPVVVWAQGCVTDGPC